MIFYGWNHVKEKVIGIFRGSACDACGESFEYRLIIRRTYFTLFFIPILCYRSEYFLKCTNCPGKKTISKEEAYEIMDRYFPEGKSKLFVGRIARITLFVALAAIAVILIADNDDGNDTNAVSEENQEVLNIEEIKDMLTDDGSYAVYNTEGKILADITVTDGVKRVNLYYEYNPYTENVPEEHDFESMQYFYERNKGEIVYIEDPAMVIYDEDLVGVRYCYYDTYDEEVYWYYGVEDFNDIEYKEDRTVYPMTQFIGNDDVEYYSKICVWDEGSSAVMTFYQGTNEKNQSELVRLDLIVVDANNNSEDWMKYYQSLDLSPESTFSDVLDLIENSGIQYDERDYKEYYLLNDGVISYREIEWLDNKGYYKDIYDYLVELREDGYFVAKIIE